jgi:allophanate hydrolase subunit 1
VEAPGNLAAAQRRIWSLAQRLSQCDDVETLIPGVTNLLVLLRQTPEEEDAFPHRLREYWREAREGAAAGAID